MNAVTMRARLEQSFCDKPEHLDTLFIDTDEQIRDWHIEDMFHDCFYGKPLDDIFIHNFKLYFQACGARYLPNPQLPPDEVFKDEAIARAWVTMNFGLIYVGPFKMDDPNRYDDDLEHCLYEAKLRTRVADNVNESCYAPTALHAILLTVVNVMRHVSNNYHQELIA